jgi:hypothetical protein
MPPLILVSLLVLGAATAAGEPAPARGELVPVVEPGKPMRFELPAPQVVV